jgi:cell fate (sporulation/competence/biofilm development) regulator YmcA (YheA/YmcA/DUF963 family)
MDQGAEPSVVATTEEFHLLALRDKEKIVEIDYVEESLRIEKTVQLDKTELSALQRHKQAVNEYIKQHLEAVPEFLDATFLPGHVNNLNSVEQIKLQLVWILMIKSLLNPCENFEKSNYKQKLSYCKKLYKQLLPLLPRENFDDEGGIQFKNELEIQNFTLHPESLIGNFFESSSVEEVAEKIDSNPLSQEFHDQFGCDDPDTLLLRFLRARKWNLIESLLMLIDTLYWHKSFGVGCILKQGESAVKEYLLTCGKHYAWNVDYKGRLVIWIRSKLHDKNKQTLHENLVALVFLIEHARRLMAPGNENVTLIFDLSDAPLASLDIPSIQGDIQVLQNYYPECLGQCFVVDAPWIFHGIYRIVRGFLDPVVAAKIELIKSSEIIKYVHPSMVPKRYAGGCDPIQFNHPVDPNNGETRINPDLDVDALNDQIKKMRKELIWMTLSHRPREAFDPEGKRTSLRSDLKELTAKWETGILPENHYHRCGILSKTGQVNWKNQ